MNSKNVSFYVSGEDMKARTNKVADTGDACWWALDMKGKGDVNIATFKGNTSLLLYTTAVFSCGDFPKS